MACYVLVHGGGHGGWCYRYVAQILRSHGHEVHTPTMTGLAERRHLLSPAVDLYLQIRDIVEVLEIEDLRDVILVGHSYGGMIITGVADRAAGRIANLVYLDAAYPKNGESLVDHAGAIMLAARETSRVVDGIELVLFPGDDPMSFYGVTDPEQIAWMKPKLTPHPWKCFDQKLVLDNEAAVRALPQSFISCTYRMDEASREVQKTLSQGRYWEIDTGHDLMISEPRATADALLQIAGQIGQARPASAQASAGRAAAPAAAPEAKLPAPGENTSPEGTWTLKMKGPTGPMASTVIIARHEGALTGTQAFAPAAAAPITEVRIEDGKLSWINHISKPMKMKLEFSGAIEGNQISGKVKAGFVGTFSFTGAKAI